MYQEQIFIIQEHHVCIAREFIEYVLASLFILFIKLCFKNEAFFVWPAVPLMVNKICNLPIMNFQLFQRAKIDQSFFSL